MCVGVGWWGGGAWVWSVAGRGLKVQERPPPDHIYLPCSPCLPHPPPPPPDLSHPLNPALPLPRPTTSPNPALPLPSPPTPQVYHIPVATFFKFASPLIVRALRNDVAFMLTYYYGRVGAIGQVCVWGGGGYRLCATVMAFMVTYYYCRVGGGHRLGVCACVCVLCVRACVRACMCVGGCRSFAMMWPSCSPPCIPSCPLLLTHT